SSRLRPATAEQYGLGWRQALAEPPPLLRYQRREPTACWRHWMWQSTAAARLRSRAPMPDESDRLEPPAPFQYDDRHGRPFCLLPVARRDRAARQEGRTRLVPG